MDSPLESGPGEIPRENSPPRQCREAPVRWRRTFSIILLNVWGVALAGLSTLKGCVTWAMFYGNRTFFCGPYIPRFRLRSQPSVARFSRSPGIKLVHRLSITACHPRLAGARPRNLVSLSSLSQTYVDGQDTWEKFELPPSDAQRRTIFALSTPPGKAGVAVIRVSGPDALEVWQAVVDPSSESRKGKGRATEPQPWRIHRCKVLHPVSKEVLDDGLAVFFKGVNSRHVSWDAASDHVCSRSKVFHGRRCFGTAHSLWSCCDLIGASRVVISAVLSTRRAWRVYPACLFCWAT